MSTNNVFTRLSGLKEHFGRRRMGNHVGVSRLAAATRVAQIIIQNGLGRVGFRLVQASPLDLRGQTDDPIVAAYLAPGRDFLIDVPLSRCRGNGVLAFGFGPASPHPFVRTVRELAAGKCDGFLGSPLDLYYRHFRPNSAAAVLGLAQSSKLGELPALAAVAPWSAMAPPTAMNRRRVDALIENRRHGANLGHSRGAGGFGSVSEEMGARETKRLMRLHRSMIEHGYQRHDRRDGDIGASILISEGDWVCLIANGRHRIATLCGLGFPSAPIRILGGHVVRRAEVDSWPQVRSGLFTRKEALTVFDRIFDGRQPEGAVPPEWERTC